MSRPTRPTPLPIAVAAFLVWLLAASPAHARDITVFAAASLTGALAEVADGYEARTDRSVTLSFAGSSALARQIQHGAPADVFVSANTDWMDRLEDAGLIAADTRVDLLSNTLVLIAPAEGDGRDKGAATDTALPVKLTEGTDLTAMLGDGRLAMALVEAVPAGIYGKAALETLGLWPAVAGRVAQADNVRAALALVATGEAPLGLVYATDAAAEKNVRVVAEIPAGTHPPIRYPAAAVAGRDDGAARAFLDHLRGAEARAVFARHGFTPLTNR